MAELDEERKRERERERERERQESLLPDRFADVSARAAANAVYAGAEKRPVVCTDGSIRINWVTARGFAAGQRPHGYIRGFRPGFATDCRDNDGHDFVGLVFRRRQTGPIFRGFSPSSLWGWRWIKKRRNDRDTGGLIGRGGGESRGDWGVVVRRVASFTVIGGDYRLAKEILIKPEQY